MIPPRYAKSVSITNNAPHAVKVHVVFGSDEQAAEGNAKITKSQMLPAGTTAVLGNEEYDMDGSTAVAPFESIHVEAGDIRVRGALGQTQFRPSVDSIVDVLHMEVKAPHGNEVYAVTVTKQE